MYKLKIFNEKRIKTRHIIITQAINLIDFNFYIDPIVYKGTYKYTWGIWQKYLLKDLYKPALPMHYFEELLDKDYVVYKGLPDYHRSYFLKDLANYDIIESIYKDAILVVIGENFQIDIPEGRMYDHLVTKVILPLMNQYKIPKDNVKILDQCLSNNWKTNLELSPLNYDLKLHKYYDPVTLDITIGRWNKKRY